MSIDKKRYKINVHFVQHQVFYTPLYLCADDENVGDGLGYNLDYNHVPSYTDLATGEPSDKVLVNHLFQNINDKNDEIDIYITGGPHISSYSRNNPNCNKGDVLLWTTIVDRLPVLLLMSKSHGKRDYAEYSLRELAANPPEKIYSPPKDTTLHYFLSQYFDRTSFREVYYNQDTNDDKKIIEYFQKYNSIFDGKLNPVNFNEISNSLHTSEGAYGYGLPTDKNLRNFKMISPPMEIIPFTCIFTRRDVWEDESKRDFLHGFCKAVNLNISKIHRFNKYYHKDSSTKKYDTTALETAIGIYSSQDSRVLNPTELENLKQLFVGNLKHLVKQRIFAVNLQYDLELKAKGEGVTYDREIENILYNWIIQDVVKIEPTISDLENERKLKIHEQELAQTEFLKSISASTHAIKTTINTLLSAPLNSLKIGNKDHRVNLISEAKETLLINTELINLLSKLSIGNYSQESKEKALLDSKWFAKGDTNINLRNLTEKYIKVCQLDKIHFPKPIILNTEESKFDVSEEFLNFSYLNPTDRFFEFVLLTVLENCNKHAKTEKYKISFSINCSAQQLVFCNKPKNENYIQKPLTGNYLVIDSILRKLKIGEVKLELYKGLFYTKILSTNNS